MRVLALVLLLLFNTVVQAQNMSYTNQTEAGLLMGKGVNPSMINPSLGMRIKTKNAAQVILNIGFRQQRAVIYQTSGSSIIGGVPATQSKEEYKFRRLSLNFGLSF